MANQTSLYDLWAALHARRQLILGTTALSVAFAIVISYLLPPIYEAKTTFYLALPPSPTYSTELASASLPRQPFLPQADEKWAGVHLGLVASKDLARQVQAQFPQLSFEHIRKNLDVVLAESFATDVFFRHRDPELAAAVANSFADAYEQFHARAISEWSRRVAEVQRAQIAALGEELAAKRMELQRRGEALSLVSITGARATLSQLATQYEGQLEIARAEQAAAEGGYAAMLGQLTSDSGSLPGEPFRTDGPLPRSVREEFRLELGQLSAQRSSARARVEALNLSLTRLEHKKRRLSSGLLALEVLEDEVEERSATLRDLRKNHAETTLQAEHPPMVVVVVDRAVPPTVPIFPRPFLNGAVALLLGAAASFYYALLLDYLARLRRERVRRTMDRSPLREVA
jgi:uncharacterized protein involved in exopolysaccharide biosynthesis